MRKRQKLKKITKQKLFLYLQFIDNILRNLPMDTAKSIWKALKAKYESSNIQNIISLRRKLLNIKQATNETIANYIERIKKIHELKKWNWQNRKFSY